MEPSSAWLLIIAAAILALAALTWFVTWIAYATVQWCQRAPQRTTTRTRIRSKR